jgi:hypothetical protein
MFYKLDGSRHGSGMHIGVYAFTNTDVDKLMFTLQDKFNLKCSIHYNRDKNPVFIYSIGKELSKIFLDLNLFIQDLS